MVESLQKRDLFCLIKMGGGKTQSVPKAFCTYTQILFMMYIIMTTLLSTVTMDTVQYAQISTDNLLFGMFTMTLKVHNQRNFYSEIRPMTCEKR